MATVSDVRSLSDILEDVSSRTLPYSPDIDPQYVDWKDKYDTLYQQFKTMSYEKKEYEKEMKKMQQEITNLTKEYQYERSESLQFEQVAKPLFSASLQSLTSALNDSDSLKKELNKQNIKYRQLTHTVQEENYTLKQQNKQYQQIVETLKNDQYTKELEYQHKMDELKQQIQDINKEEDEIIKKYDEKSGQYDELREELLRTQMETSQPHDVEVVAQPYMNMQTTVAKHQMSRYMVRFLSNKDIDPKLYSSDKSLPGLSDLDDMTSRSNDFYRCYSESQTDVYTERLNEDERLDAEFADGEIDNERKIVMNMIDRMKENEILIAEFKSECERKEFIIGKLEKKIIKLIKKDKENNCKSCFTFFD